MTQMNVVDNGRNTRNQEATHCTHPAQAYLACILERLSCLDLPAQEHFEAYLRYKVRVNHKTQTIGSSFTSIVLFLDFYGRSGKREIKEVERSDRTPPRDDTERNRQLYRSPHGKEALPQDHHLPSPDDPALLYLPY